MVGEPIGGAEGKDGLIVGGRWVGGKNSIASGDSLWGEGNNLSGVGFGAGAATLGEGVEVAGGEW